ncbi:MAG: glycosyltransferase N-terminal domain-containing protein, partial [candidate division WOR-3 bacterium]
IHHDGPVIWIHAVSVGETLAIQSLVEAIQKHFANARLIISTITETGQTVARSRFNHAAQIIYFPFDWRFTVKRAIRRLNPSVVLIVETEIWPNFLHVCYQRRIPTILVSGRISAKSYQHYKLVRPFMKRFLACIHRLLMQTETDASRIIALGAEAAKVEVIGNLKLDVKPPQSETALAATLDELFGLSKTEHLIVAGSTSDGEEAVILEAFRTLRAKNKSLAEARLVIAPRRPERFQEVERIIACSGLTHVKRSRAGKTRLTERAEVILLDSVGELASVYSFAKAAVLGGSLLGLARHNYVEPVSRGACVVVGPSYGNCEGIDGLLCLSDVDRHAMANTLADSLQRILLDDETRTRLVSKAKESIERSQGATLKVIAHLRNLLAKETHIRLINHVNSSPA